MHSWAGRALTIIIALAFSGSATLYAQTRTPARIVSGVVIDASGAVLPNARVDLTDAAGTVLDSAVTSDSGTFSFGALKPGRYAIQIALEGSRRRAWPIDNPFGPKVLPMSPAARINCHPW
jgi:hypothetical protein